jgi:hypothetical protein
MRANARIDGKPLEYSGAVVWGKIKIGRKESAIVSLVEAEGLTISLGDAHLLRRKDRSC